MLNALARVGDNTNVVANAAALVPHYNPKKEAARKMAQVQSSSQSNKSNISDKEEKDLPHTVKSKFKDGDAHHDLKRSIDFVA